MQQSTIPDNITLPNHGGITLTCGYCKLPRAEGPSMTLQLVAILERFYPEITPPVIPHSPTAPMLRATSACNGYEALNLI
jgi:hypothetical protein